MIRAVRHNKTGFKRNFELDDSERIILAIEYMTQNYPKRMVPIALLFWMCNPGMRLGKTGSEAYEHFKARVSRQKNKMIAKFKRSFFIQGPYMRGYVSPEEHAAMEVPKARRSLTGAYNRAEALSVIVGNPEKLKVGIELNQDQKAAARDFQHVVASIGQSIKGLLAAAPTIPTKRA